RITSPSLKLAARAWRARSNGRKSVTSPASARMSRAFARTGCNSPSAARMRSSLGSRTGVACSEGRVVQIILISDRLAKARAVKLGEMQAQLTRLDALGERLSSLAGMRPQEFRLSEAPGLGGAAPTLMPPQNLSLADFNEKLLTLSREVESRNDMLGVLEAQLFEQAVKKKLMPTMLPVAAPYNASGFGKRIDPFNGQWTMHEGIDFLADAGSPVVNAAAGVVQFAGFHPQYGYVIDIDHGNDLV